MTVTIVVERLEIALVVLLREIVPVIDWEGALEFVGVQFVTEVAHAVTTVERLVAVVVV